MNPVRRLVAGKGESVVCELTANGRGAICVLAISGPNVPNLLNRQFQAANGKPLSAQPTMKPIYGRWKKEDIIACVHDKSYVELHCHGGDFAKQRIVADLEAAGFARRVFPDVEDLSSTAEAALIELARTTTRKTAAILTWQSEGALDRELEKIDQSVNDGKYTAAIANIESLLNFHPLGLRLTHPWKIAVAGVPNAGKSSLINRIVGYGRSIVFDTPGTTRDLVTVQTAINGWPVELIDTAGLRRSTDQIEQLGIELAEQAVASSDLTIEVVDVTDPASTIFKKRPGNRITVLNKRDLAEPRTPLQGIRISALTGEGIEDLLELVSSTLVPIEPGYGTAVPFLASQFDDLRKRLNELTS